MQQIYNISINHNVCQSVHKKNTTPSKPSETMNQILVTYSKEHKTTVKLKTVKVPNALKIKLHSFRFVVYLLYDMLSNKTTKKIEAMH